ncbi:MFS transporter [bacterium]|nr:MFS transporter [bacterium]
MLGMTGFRLVNAPTFVPAYLHSITGSDALVGLGAAVQQIGAFLSPISGAASMEHRKRLLPASIRLGWLMRIQILGLAVSAWLFTGMTAAGLALLFLLLLGLFQGSQRVAFQSLLAKVIPIRMRGRLQGWRNMVGGLIAAILSYIAGEYLIAGQMFGNGYAATFLAAFILTSLGLMVFSVFIREPDPPTVRARAALRDRLRELPALIREDRGYMWFLGARTLAMGSRIGQPYFFIAAAGGLGLSTSGDAAALGSLLALLSVAYMAADTVSSLVWGYMADRFGFRATFIAAMAVFALAIGLLLAGGSMLVYALAFAGVGAAQSGYFIASTNLVMEFGHRNDIPMRMAISNTAEGIAGALAPLVGWLLVIAAGYQAAFIATLLSCLAAVLVLAFLVDEPRRRAGAV